jgi:hypothetical protein
MQSRHALIEEVLTHRRLWVSCSGHDSSSAVTSMAKMQPLHATLGLVLFWLLLLLNTQCPSAALWFSSSKQMEMISELNIATCITHTHYQLLREHFIVESRSRIINSQRYKCITMAPDAGLNRWVQGGGHCRAHRKHTTCIVVGGDAWTKDKNSSKLSRIRNEISSNERAGQRRKYARNRGWTIIHFAPRSCQLENHNDLGDIAS